MIRSLLMFEQLIRSYQIFQEHGIEDSLTETLKLFDLLSGGMLSTLDRSSLENSSIDLETIAESRKQGIPMEYIVGKAIFMGLTYHCTPDTLIPRAETELLVRSTLRLIRERDEKDRALTLIEIGTGCGNIAVALALRAPNVRIFASDISPEAITVTQRNIDEYDLHDRIELSCGDLFESFSEDELGGMVDLVVCNPPYIPTGSIEKMDTAITSHEPILAFDAGAYGIDIFRKLIVGSIPYLRRGGILVFEIGAGQKELVDMLFKKSKAYENVRYIDDGNDVRVISAQKR